VIGGKLRTDTQLVFAEPRGILFRASVERQRYLRDLRGTTDRNEAMAARSTAQPRLRASPCRMMRALTRPRDTRAPLSLRAGSVAEE
jgi:hypothetical protein